MCVYVKAADKKLQPFVSLQLHTRFWRPDVNKVPGSKAECKAGHKACLHKTKEERSALLLLMHKKGDKEKDD